MLGVAPANSGRQLVHAELERALDAVLDDRRREPLQQEAGLFSRTMPMAAPYIVAFAYFFGSACITVFTTPIGVV